jgi:2-dehydropantoate 2-reductase
MRPAGGGALTSVDSPDGTMRAAEAAGGRVWMRFVVYGAGAVGGVIGGRLFQAGHDVSLIARGAHGAAIRDHGLRLETPEESVTLPVPVADHPSGMAFEPGDVVILAMKTQDTAAALTALAACAPPDIVVVCAQNGVENERLALRLFERVYGVCVVTPTAHSEPGVVEVYAAPLAGSLDIGRYPVRAEGAGSAGGMGGADGASGANGADDGTAVEIAAAFQAAGFAAQPRPDIMRLKYGKLLTNLGNAAEALFGRGEETERIVALARQEGVACLDAAGIGHGDAARPEGLRMRPIPGRRRTGSSSWQSLQRGTGSVEADYLNGEVVLLGRAHGVPTPVNELLRRHVNAMARDRRPPGESAPRDFLAALTSSGVPA